MSSPPISGANDATAAPNQRSDRPLWRDRSAARRLALRRCRAGGDLARREGRRIFPGLSVKENIMLGGSNRRVGKAELSREADAMFDLFPDIRPFSNALGWALAGGELQMVAVARGLMAKPRLLLLDGPSLRLG